jgi:hypothetical protein
VRQSARVELDTFCRATGDEQRVDLTADPALPVELVGIVDP